MKIKVCGMKFSKNIQELSALSIDYMGFIFFEKSARNFSGSIPKISERIKKTGVFVNASFKFIQEKVLKYGFKAVQLHSGASPSFCREVKELGVEVFKVFSVKDNFDFSILENYETYTDFFLFDTKGKYPGGNGEVFDWRVLKNYTSKTPFILSGGIGLEKVKQLREILNTDLPIHALDINSKFEIKPADKDIGKIKEFLKMINTSRKSYNK